MIKKITEFVNCKYFSSSNKNEISWNNTRLIPRKQISKSLGIFYLC